jgi:hypothetical protein
MTETEYIKCGACKCKYINDAEHIKTDFGFNRLEVQYKTCVKCREKKREWNHSYGIRHRAEITERTREYNKQHRQDNKEQYQEWNKQYRERQLNQEVNTDQKCCTRCYKIKPVSEYGEVITELQFKSCDACRLRDTSRIYR